jgi:hypothetical protein
LLNFQNVPPVPVYMKFYVFQVENPDNVTAGIEKPRLKEKGPYAYREVRKKVRVTIICDIPNSEVAFLISNGHLRNIC